MGEYRWPWVCGVCGSRAYSYTEEGARDALMAHFLAHTHAERQHPAPTPEPAPGPERCGACNGTGKDYGGYKCPRCLGTGKAGPERCGCGCHRGTGSTCCEGCA